MGFQSCPASRSSGSACILDLHVNLRTKTFYTTPPLHLLFIFVPHRAQVATQGPSIFVPHDHKVGCENRILDNVEKKLGWEKNILDHVAVRFIPAHVASYICLCSPTAAQVAATKIFTSLHLASCIFVPHFA